MTGKQTLYTFVDRNNGMNIEYTRMFGMIYPFLDDHYTLNFINFPI